MNVKLLSLSLLVISVFTIADGIQVTESDNSTDPTPKRTFKEAEKEVIDFINEQLRSILPKVVGGAGSSALSQQCQAGLMKIFGNIRRLKGWTLKILDSMGKPTAGILKGTSYSMGHYDQCVDLMVTRKGYETHNLSEANFQGMYCKVRIQFMDPIVETAIKYQKGEINATELGKLKEVILATPYVPLTSEFMSHFLGVCLPSSCSFEDAQQIVQMISFPGSATVERCEVKSETELNETQTTVLIIFIVLICLVCLSTLFHWLFHAKINEAKSSFKDRRCVSVTVSFSFCHNTKSLMKNIEDDSDHTLGNQCVRGIVAASVSWIILGHTYLFPYDAFYIQSSSLENLQNYLAEGYFAPIVNYPLAIDALLVCYGYIMTFTLWNAACNSEGVKINVIALMIQNYLRIIIPVLLCLGVVILLPTIGSGPFWNDFMDSAIDKCYKTTWAYVGLYSNFLDPDEQCFPHLWFTSCLAQLTFVSIILCWILARCFKLGIFIIALLTLAGNIAVGIYTYNSDFPPSFVPYFAENATNVFWKLNYSLPLSHFGSYALGMLAGILVARKERHPFRPFLAAVGWVICICLLVGMMIWIHRHHIEPMSAFWSAAYAGSHRTLFAACVTWILVSCSFGNGGFVNAIFSSRIFDPIFRLSYYAYIFHFIVIAFITAVSRVHFNYSHLDMVLKAISYIAVSYAVAYIAYMILEMPLTSLCRAFCPKKSSQINVTSLNNFSNTFKADNLTSNSTVEGSCKLWSVYNNKNSLPY